MTSGMSKHPIASLFSLRLHQDMKEHHKPFRQNTNQSDSGPLRRNLMIGGFETGWYDIPIKTACGRT